MKKRTFVCFLIFTLCVFYSSIPNTVLGQDESLAQQVFDKYSETLQREDIQAVLPRVLEGLKAPNIQDLLTPATISLVVAQPDLLTQFVPGIDPSLVTLLKEDAELIAMFSDPLVQELLQDPAAIEELGTLVPPPVEEPMTPPVVEPPTPPIEEPATPPIVEPPTPPEVTLPPVEVPMADTFPQIMPTNEYLLGKSRLGGLALNGIGPKNLIQQMLKVLQIEFERAGAPLPQRLSTAEAAVELALGVIPKGFIPKKQVRQLLLSSRLSPFQQPEAAQLDYENFGNAITPDFADFAYLEGSSKHLTRDSLGVYVRVPAKVGGVKFSISGREPVDGREVTEEMSLEGNIPYTFRLDESLAATNLPAWPGLSGPLFSGVRLYISTEGPNGAYISTDMVDTVGENGVVWESQGTTVPTGRSIFYYFEVILAEPVAFKTLDRRAIEAMSMDTVTLADVLDPKNYHEIIITKWAMPDPRNLQIWERGIVERLITEDLAGVFRDILNSPEVASIIAKVDESQFDVTKLLGVVTPQQRNKIFNLLMRNTDSLWSHFETENDPLLASVFTVPRVDPQSESLWIAQIEGLADGNYQLGAIVHDTHGNPLDQIQENFTVDTSAPEADIRIMPGTNAAGYENAEGIYVAAAVDASAPATLNIMGMPKRADIGPGVGYLYYQQLGLDAYGVPESNWMPLTVESTMLTSDVWTAVQEAMASGRLARPTDPTLQGLLALPFDVILTTLNADLLQTFANPFLKNLRRQTGLGGTLNDTQAQLVVDALDATVDILDHLVPVTINPSDHVTIPLIEGDYGIRAMGIDTLLNVGSYTAPTELSVILAKSDMASVIAASIGDRNGDNVVGGPNAPYESGPGVTIYANTTDGVMLTVTVSHRTPHPASISVQYKDATGMWQTIGEARGLAEGEEVSTYEVSWDVTDFDALVAAGDSVMVRTLARNDLAQQHTSEPFAIKLDAGVHPVEFEVIALVLDSESITKTNPDSGGPQGTVTISAYTPERVSPEIASFKLMVEGEVIGTVSAPPEVIDASELSGLEENADFLDDIIRGAVDPVSGGAASAPIAREHPDRIAVWSVEVDTTALEDTITKDSPAARDASKDENQHLVTAIAMTDAGEKPAPDTVKSLLSVDNVDDVGPLGPTNIVAVTNVAEGVEPQPVEANEDGSYSVGGIVDEMVPAPMDTLTIEPTADPKTYTSVNLIQTDPDGTETVTEGEAGVLEITVDVSMLEGTYMFHALAVDEFGNVQTDESPKTAVHVLNFEREDMTDPVVMAVDGVDVAEPPAEPIPLRESITVGFTVAKGSLAADQLSARINESTATSEPAEDPETTFSLMVFMVPELSTLPYGDGLYTPEGVVTQWNGSISFLLASVNVDNTGPIIVIETPSEDDTVDSLPTVHATYDDGEGSGVDSTGQGVLAWATTELADGPTIGLKRMLPEQGDQEVDVDQAAIETNEDTLVYTRSEQLSGGAYEVIVYATDVLGNKGMASREFAISGTIPTVAIHSPTSGQTLKDTTPLISGEISGAGALEITTFTVDGVDATPEVQGHRFTYTPDGLRSGEHTVVVEVTDGDGRTAQTSTSFAIVTDTSPPVISAVSPTGMVVIKDDSKLTISAVVSDDQSDVISVKFSVDDQAFRIIPRAEVAAGRLQIDDFFKPGTHTIKMAAVSEGGTTEHTWTFTVVADNVAPSITSITPSGTIRGGLPTISASANDASGVDEIDIALWDSDGEEVEGNTADDGEDDVEGITRLDFIPENPLDEGTYTIDVRATDTIGNSATAKGTFTIDFDTAAPVVTLSSPQQDARLVLRATDEAPTVSITYMDAESGINVDSIVLVIEGPLPELKATPSGTKIALKSNQKSASQVTYPLPLNMAALAQSGDGAGKYVVRFEVSDNAHLDDNVSEKNGNAHTANTTVHEFSFFIESAAAPVLLAPPVNMPNPFKDTTDITFGLARRSAVSIIVYDMTLRPVKVLMDNEMREVGQNGIRWDGTSSSGEDLARGVYFCQIIVTDSLEPKYAILKLALTR